MASSLLRLSGVRLPSKAPSASVWPAVEPGVRGGVQSQNHTVAIFCGLHSTILRPARLPHPPPLHSPSSTKTHRVIRASAIVHASFINRNSNERLLRYCSLLARDLTINDGGGGQQEGCKSSTMSVDSNMSDAAAPSPSATTMADTPMLDAEDNQQLILDSDIGPYDIICGRDSESFNRIGNRRFRITLSIYLPRYTGATTRASRSEVISAIIKMLKFEAGARFLKRTKGGGYVELDHREMRQKVTHGLRDMHFHQQSMLKKQEDDFQEGVADLWYFFKSTSAKSSKGSLLS